MVSVANALNIGSGIDTAALVADLSAAAKAARLTSLTRRSDSNQAQISAAATLRAGIDSLADGFKDAPRSTEPDAAKVLLKNFIAAYNQLRAAITQYGKPAAGTLASGPLAGDAMIRTLASAMGKLSLKNLATTGTITLGDMGVSTMRDGSLKLDETRFDAAILADPAGIAAVLAPTGGLTTVLDGMRDGLEATGGALTDAVSRYERISKRVERERVQMEEANARLVERLTTSFSGMDRQIAALKAVQNYITQQVAAWNAAR